MDEIYISKSLLGQLAKSNSAAKICNGAVNEIIQVGLDAIVCSGGSESGALGIIDVKGYKVTYLELYDNPLAPPISYNEWTVLVHENKRVRSYEGITFKHQGRMMVFVGQSITFKAAAEPKQLKLFEL